MTNLIEDNFYIYKNKYYTYNVQLNLNSISYTPCSNKIKQNETVKELVKDIIGCALMKSKNNEDKKSVFITIYSYPLKGSRKKSRKKKVTTFEVTYKNTFHENLEIANKWRSLLYYAMYYCKEGEHISTPLYKIQKKILIIINPKSGPGIALDIFEKKVKPLLCESEVDYDKVITDHAQHGYELIQHKDLQLYSGIVIIAGDGLLYEIYNGLLQRSDSDTALSIPIGIIPGGSGNGLASSISYLLDEPYLSNPVLVSTLNIVNPVVHPMDLVLLQTPNKQRLISFLSIGFGIIADIDIESESLRALGELRFTAYGLTRILKLRKYRARLSYKINHEVAKLASSSTSKKRPAFLRSQTIEEGVSSSNEGAKTLFPPRPLSMNFRLTDEVDLTPVELASEVCLDNMSRIKKEKKETGTRMVRSEWQSQHQIKDHVDIDFEQPVPQDWETIEDDFVSIYAVNQPFIGSDNFLSPKSTLNDGVMWLCYIKGNVSKTNVFKFLSSLDGQHIHMPDVRYLPVTALRLVPLCPSGKITVDGELIDFGPFQASMLPGKGRIMTRRK